MPAALDHEIDLHPRSRPKVGESPVGEAVSRKMHDLGDDEVLERLPVLVGPGPKRHVERSLQRSPDPGVEVVELRIGALLLPDRAVKRGQEKADQRVFQDAEVGDDGLRIRCHVPREVGVVDDRAIRLRGDLQELPERIEPADELLGDDLLFQVGQGVCPGNMVGSYSKYGS